MNRPGLVPFDEALARLLGRASPATTPEDVPTMAASGRVHGPAAIRRRSAVIDAPLEKGHVLLFSNNPIWRGETHGSYFLVFNALLNFDQLGAGRQLDAR